MKKQIMMVIDHYEEDMFKQQNGQLVNNFKNSSIGRALYRQIIGHPRIGIDTKNVDLNIQFFYTKQIPSKNRYTNQYKKPTAKQLRDSYNTLVQRIKQEQPDIVICYGSWFASILAKEYDLNRNDFKPSKLDLDDFVTYVSFCPSPKLFNYMGSYERDTLRIENRMINRFIAGGIESLKPQMGKYKLIKDFNEAKQILTKEVYQHPIVACDFETNTLETYRKDAKAIMMSISWKEHQGVSIPLNHRLEPNLWTKEQFNQLIKWINQLMSSKQWKVFHNGMYDVHMLMDIYGLHKATHVVDTMLMYYEMVDESQGAVRGLKHLSYLYTDMGGYEDTRDQAFQDYLNNYYDKWLATEMEKYKNGERKTKPSHRNYTPPTNPVDGSSIDFEWLPMDVVYPYASADTDVTLQIYDQLKGLVSKRKKWHHLIYEFYPELLDVLAYMQHIGFQVDTDKLGRYRKHFTEDIKDLTQRMYDCTPEIQEYEKDGLSKLQEREKIKKIKPADRTEEQKKLFKEYAKYRGEDSSGVPNYKFNPSSGNKVAYILYKMMGYKLPAEKEYLKPKAVSARKLSHPEKLTWKDYKVDRKSALPYLVKEYNDDLAKLLLQYSSDKKMLTATVEGYSKMLDDTGKLHPRFLIHGCLDGDTLIATSKGLKKIKDLSNNRVVDKFYPMSINIIDKDNKSVSTEYFYYSGVNNAYKIQLANGNSIIATSNHPFLVNDYLKTHTNVVLGSYRNTKYWNNYFKQFNGASWTQVSDIKTGYYIKGTIGGNLYGNKTYLDFNDNDFPNNTRSHDKPVTLPHKLTPELAELLGMYIADGSYSATKRSHYIGITNDDPEVQRRIKYLIKKVFSVNPSVYVDHRKGAETTISIGSVQIFNYLRSVFNIGSRGYEKEVPQAILDSSKDVQQAFLKGLTLDSSVKKKKYPSIYLCTTSYEQAHAVYVMLLNMGIYARIAKRKIYHSKGYHRIHDHPSYDIMISYQDAQTFVNKIGFEEIEHKQKILLEKIEHYSTSRNPTYRGIIRHGNTIWLKVVSIDYLDRRPMFDLQVPISHSFWSNGIISHNTSTGRLASRAVNAQNIAKPTSNVDSPNYNYSGKALFKSRFKGGYLLNIDYKSLEVFIATLISKDEGMMQALMDGADIHKRNASIAFDIPIDEVDPSHRQLAKAVN